MRHFPVTLVLLLALAAPASAGELAVRDGKLIVAAESQERLDVDIVQDGAESFTVYDYSGDLTPGSGCAPPPPSPTDLVFGGAEGTYDCSGAIATVDVQGGDDRDFVFLLAQVPGALRGAGGDDYLYLGAGGGSADGGPGSDSLENGDKPAQLIGGDGDDYLGSGSGADHLVGGAGADHLVGDTNYEDFETGEPAAAAAGSPDVLEGGSGNDVLDGGPGADVLDGGSGRDTAEWSAAAVSVSLNGVADDGAAGENDQVLGIENVSTGRFDDTISGDASVNQIFSGDGNDTIDPGGAFDIVESGAGDDTINARDGVQDDISCGEGADRVTADPDDYVADDCETVERAAAAAGPAPIAPAASHAVKPLRFDISARRRGGSIVVTGRVRLPAGASGCAGGGVTVRLRGLARRTKSVGTVLRANCSFVVRVRAKGRRVARVSASFAGTPNIAPASSRTVRAR